MDEATGRSVRVASVDDSLLQALHEHRSERDGWRIAALDGPPEADALIILDLEDADTRRRLVQDLRSGGFAGPILILGENGGIWSPDDEPLQRPVRLGTLLARIDAHWAEPSDNGARSLGPYQFVPDERMLRHWDSDQLIRLTELERKLLVHLAAAGGMLVSREQLLAGVWGYSVGTDTHTVETHIWRLRQKIETDDPATRFLVTEPGGYRLLMAENEAGG